MVGNYILYETLIITDLHSCSPAIRELFKTTEVLHFMNGYTPKTRTHGEVGKLEVCKYHALIWYTMALS